MSTLQGFTGNCKPLHFSLIFAHDMAGAAGIEPANAGIKSRCLTAWRRPILSMVSIITQRKAMCVGGLITPDFRNAITENSENVVFFASIFLSVYTFDPAIWIRRCAALNIHQLLAQPLRHLT